MFLTNYVLTEDVHIHSFTNISYVNNMYRAQVVLYPEILLFHLLQQVV